MSISAKEEARLLSAAELELVSTTRYPEILALTPADLKSTVQRLREMRDRAQAIARQQRREMRGKSDPRGARPARENAGTATKEQVLAQALKRANSELRQHEEPEVIAPSQAELSQKAFAMKQAARATSHPSAGRTASGGMTAKSSNRRTVETDPREVGRVSQAVKSAQASRDA